MKTIATDDPNVLHIAAKVLKGGGLVILPSDTVYGIAVDAKNDAAVEKLIKFKSRPQGKAISVFCGAIEKIEDVVAVDANQKKIIEKLLPGPYTLVLHSNGLVSRLLEAENHTLGIRVPDNQLVNNLVNFYGGPLTATSANIAGRSPHYSLSSLLHSLPLSKASLIDLVIDGGTLPRNKPSTVVDLTKDDIEILRKGDVIPDNPDAPVYISHSELESIKIAGEVIDHVISANEKSAKLRKPLVILLEGDLGAGKTVFVKGISKRIGVTSVVSPTFVIYYEYQIHDDSSVADYFSTFVHADLYRIKHSDEYIDLGLENYLKPGVIMCIEWAEKLSHLYESFLKKAYCVKVEIDYIGESSRRITVSQLSDE